VAHIEQTQGATSAVTWEKQVLLARGFKIVGRKPLRIRHINGMGVYQKRLRGFKKRPRRFK
jgi:hypothetical protein